MFLGRKCCTSDTIGGQLLDRALREVAAVTPGPAAPTGRVRPDPARPADRQVEVFLAGSLQWLSLTEWREVEAARAKAEALSRTPKAKRTAR